MTEKNYAVKLRTTFTYVIKAPDKATAERIAMDKLASDLEDIDPFDLYQGFNLSEIEEVPAQ